MLVIMAGVDLKDSFEFDLVPEKASYVFCFRGWVAFPRAWVQVVLGFTGGTGAHELKRDTKFLGHLRDAKPASCPHCRWHFCGIMGGLRHEEQVPGVIVDAREFLVFTPGVFRAHVMPKHLGAQRLIPMVLVTIEIPQLQFVPGG